MAEMLKTRFFKVGSKNLAIKTQGSVSLTKKIEVFEGPIFFKGRNRKEFCLVYPQTFLNRSRKLSSMAVDPRILVFWWV